MQNTDVGKLGIDQYLKAIPPFECKLYRSISNTQATHTRPILEYV